MIVGFAAAEILFGEDGAVAGIATGDLGQIPSTAVMALALAHARRLSKFGA